MHVVHRGNNRIPIFLADADYSFFRHCLREGGLGDGIELHSYVLMTNHVHLLVTADDDSGISKLVQSAAGRYVAYFNKKYDRSGTLWEGRFHAATIKSDYYVLACHRYIDMNPVRAGLADDPAEYPWSSHTHFALGKIDDLLTAHPTILALAHEEGRRRMSYRRLFETQLAGSDLEAIRGASKTRRELGVDSFGARRRGRPRKVVSDTI